MKLYLAISVPEDVQSQLERQLQNFKNQYPYYTWVPKKNFNIIINYIGDVDKSNFDAIKDRIQDILYDAETFHMFSLEPKVSIDKKITLYLGFQRQKKLEEIDRKISADLGVKGNYKFIPEIIFAGWKIPSKQQYFHLKNELDNLELNIEFPVTELSLLQSVSTSDVPTFIEVAKLPLQMS